MRVTEIKETKELGGDYTAEYGYVDQNRTIWTTMFVNQFGHVLD